ncbi:serine hydrolase domain-containing protein [Dactylosporangium sp. CS-033363]|uniref:serine hydrolase domain-containing protein n=1 Tax=Dactylosporangium sp. CS-033363 TaxID=3239935 RepID=UPI003D9362C9
MSEMTQVRERVVRFCQETGVPGFLVGVYRSGKTDVFAHGVANVNTGAPMREDTGFLFGSITKVMTTMLVLQQVEQKKIDLDAPVVRYLPEFRLAEDGAAGRITVRQLLTHTSGIDADLYFPAGCGPRALQEYMAGMARQCGTLFEPGRYVSYSNGGMIVAGRLLEVVTGRPYLELLQSEVFARHGMAHASTSAEEAVLRSTAIGHFNGRPTGMFKLPDTWGPAGASAIGTVGDLLALGRVHLGGDNPMAVPQHDMGVANVPPVGMGWLLEEFGGAKVLSMSGASPGGVAVLAVVPERDLVIAAYGNDPAAFALHNELVPALVGPAAPPVLAAPDEDLRRYAGTYRSQQLRVDVSVVGDELEERVTYEPADAGQEAIFTAFAGGTVTGPPQRYAHIGAGLFAPAGLPVSGYNRVYLVSYLGDDESGRATHRCAGGRMNKRSAA